MVEERCLTGNGRWVTDTGWSVLLVTGLLARLLGAAPPFSLLCLSYLRVGWPETRSWLDAFVRRVADAFGPLRRRRAADAAAESGSADAAAKRLASLSAPRERVVSVLRMIFTFFSALGRVGAHATFFKSWPETRSWLDAFVFAETRRLGLAGAFPAGAKRRALVAVPSETELSLNWMTGFVAIAVSKRS